jgi:hypothetical protein
MIIGTRTLLLESADGAREIVINLYAPHLRNKSWFCDYEIGWPEKIRRSEAGGVDAIQAIFLALQKISIELYTSPYHACGLLSWPKQPGGYGFPMVKGGRDLLVGVDREFDG